MGNLSEEKYEIQLQRVQEKNLSKERKLKLKKEKAKYRHKMKLPTTSKIVLLVVFLLCIEIIVFSEYAMIVLGDTSAMYTLIGVPTTLVPTLLAYYGKSKSENTSGGIVYEKAMRELAENSNDIDGAKG